MAAQRGLWPLHWSGGREVSVISIRVRLSSGKVLTRQEGPVIPKTKSADTAVCLKLQAQVETQYLEVSSQPSLSEPDCLSPCSRLLFTKEGDLLRHFHLFFNKVSAPFPDVVPLSINISIKVD